MQPKPLQINNVSPECVAKVRAGGLIIFPTETLYGLGCIATDAAALGGLFEAKERGPGQPPPVLISDAAQLASLAPVYNDTAAALMQAYWPGFLTLILPARDGLSPLLTGIAADGNFATVGVRMTSHPLARELCERIGQPIVATSANISGATGNAANPHRVEDIDPTLQARVDVLLDGGPVRGEPSTIIDCSGTAPRIVRPGAVKFTEEELAAYGK